MPFAKWCIDDVLGETIRSKECLRWLVTTQSIQFLRLFHHYKQGNLIWSGGLYEQPAKYLEAMEYLQARQDRIVSERMTSGRT